MLGLTTYTVDIHAELQFAVNVLMNLFNMHENLYGMQIFCIAKRYVAVDT